ncbi:MAG: hypothetical protein C0459_01810 [Chitinophaga sp.]|jgi:hypothetical protein|nr:hypothetical protein [Chitinophaga sp.]
MNKNKLDIIDKVLDACYKHNPDALFVMSLMHQYEERGSLSKKQLQGLYQKALKVKDMPANWLATLEATILKMPTRDKTPVEESKPIFQKDESLANTVKAILNKYPQHKQVLFFQHKLDKNEQLTATELNDLKRFEKLLMK